MNFSETAEFSKELKKLSKAYRSIPSDLVEFKKVVAILHLPKMQHLFATKAYAKLTITATRTVVKARFDCQSLGKKQMLRIVFLVANDGSNAVFIELFAKNQKPREDSSRIKKYLS